MNTKAVSANPGERAAEQKRGALDLLDEEGGLLAAARVSANAGRMIEIVVDRRSTGRLLQYLYGQSRRSVFVESDGVRLPGRLFTRWDGHRHWLVQLGRGLAPSKAR